MQVAFLREARLRNGFNEEKGPQQDGTGQSRN
jgi:hypothetical protein